MKTCIVIPAFNEVYSNKNFLDFKDKPDNKIASNINILGYTEKRQHVIESKRGWIIDDTYNSNPVSFVSAVDTLRNFNCPGKKIIVCADMLELGGQSKKLHQQMGQYAARNLIDVVVSFGKSSRDISETARRYGGGIQTFHFNSLTKMHRKLKRIICDKDAVLVKGSRGMRMERTVEYLKEAL